MRSASSARAPRLARAATAAGSAAPAPRPAPAPRRSARERLGASRRPRAARSSISAIPCRASSASQAAQRRRAPRAGADAREQRVALRQRLRSRRGAWPRGPATARRRPGRRARGAARAPLDQLQPVGQEHADQRPLGDVEQRSTGAPSTRHPLRLAGLEADRSSCAPSVAVGARPRRARPGPEAHHSRSLVVRQERPVQPKYSASSRFVLPAPFGPVTTVRPSPSAASARVVAAEVAQLTRRPHAHRPQSTRSTGSA